MSLKPNESLITGLAVATVVYAVYEHTLPSVADTQASSPNSPTLDKSRKVATWTAAGIVAGVSLLAKDPTIFVIGGTVLVALDFSHRHANSVNPDTQKITAAGSSSLGGNAGGANLNYSANVSAGV
jgi:hypothetical protein